jgi:hypothetical protein
LKGSVHAGEIHDVEGLDLARAFGERPAFHCRLDRVPGYCGLHEMSVGRGRSECSVEHERAGGLHLRVELGPGLEVGFAAARSIRVGPHQHQIAHAVTVSRRSDIDRGRSKYPGPLPTRSWHSRPNGPGVAAPPTLNAKPGTSTSLTSVSEQVARLTMVKRAEADAGWSCKWG